VSAALALGIQTARPAPWAEASCFTGYYQVEYLVNYVTTANGVNVANPGMSLYNDSISCTKISSIAASLNNDNYVEMGWYEDPTGDLTNCDSTSGSPRLLVYALIGGNTIDCKKGTQTVTAAAAYRIQDLDNDTVWGYFFNDVSQGTYNTLMNKGVPVDNGERHTHPSTGDTPRARFNGLQWHITVWNNWSTPLQNIDTDNYTPNYHGCVYSGGVLTTVQSSAC
jgi:hypothetical protein